MAGDGVHLTAPADGVSFRLHPERWGQWAWTSPGSDDAFLALDLNDNGVIDSGLELFGDRTEQVDAPERNGFAALGVYDLPERGGNGDGVIDAHDAVWPRLRLWRDADHDGHSARDELRGVDESGVSLFSLDYSRSSHVDEHGNEFRFVGTIVAIAPIGRTVSDVWLQQIPVATPQTRIIAVCSAWSYEVSASNQWVACFGSEINNAPILIARMTSGIREVREVLREGVSNSNSETQASIDAISRLTTATINCGDSVGLRLQPEMYPPPYFYESTTLGIRVKCWHEDTGVDPPPNDDGGGGC